jgi:hypothetical protein
VVRRARRAIRSIINSRQAAYSELQIARLTLDALMFR